MMSFEYLLTFLTYLFANLYNRFLMVAVFKLTCKLPSKLTVCSSTSWLLHTLRLETCRLSTQTLCEKRLPLGYEEGSLLRVVKFCFSFQAKGLVISG